MAVKSELEYNIVKVLLNTASSDRWQRVGLRRRAGVLTPLFSVYSERSCGIGDFEDLKLLADFCQRCGYSIIQLLPMNEVGPLFCPYDSVSSFALEPAYISLDRLAAAKKSPLNSKIEKLKKIFSLNRPHLDYRIKEEKTRLLWEIYFEEEPANIGEFKKFCAENSYWLDDFALFKALKEHNRSLPWYEWEERYRNRHLFSLREFLNAHSVEIIFQKWLQWQLYLQFKEARQYAQGKNILLKGDLPILVSRDSADVWAHREFFKLEFAAGAPPDMYCAKGQRWGMPTYNWQNIKEDNFRYIKEKLKYAENFYDILRIDHVVGLFRIWSIPYQEPLENQGLHGSFDPKDESRWEEHGRAILSVMLHSAGMLLCAEDLGIIPAICPKTLNEFGLPGNDVQRWKKDWQVKHDFLTAADYRLLSVAMLSTHDTTNFTAWWENEAGTVDEALFIRKCNERGIDYDALKYKLFDPAFSRHGRLRWLKEVRKEDVPDFVDMYADTYLEKEKLWKGLKLDGIMREKCSPHIVKEALKFTLNSNAIFCIELLQDWLSIAGIFPGDPYQYRINTPGTISPDNWSQLLPLSLEELLEHKVCAEIKEMISQSARL